MGFLGAELLGGREEPSPSAQTFALPNWEGDPISQVRQEAIDRGLVLDEQPDFSEDVPEDSVIRTEPEAGAQVSEGDTITVFVSSGQETVEVPILVGQTRNEANITLTQADLRLGAVDDEFSDRPEGTVIRSSPAAGIEVDVGSQVDIVLSRGPEPTPTPPPTPPPTPTPPPPPTPTPAPTPTP
jgi:eukaryotic-like serine/threonine-protein kinase